MKNMVAEITPWDIMVMIAAIFDVVVIVTMFEIKMAMCLTDE